MYILAGATRPCNLVDGTQRGAAKTWSLQQVYSDSLNSLVFFSSKDSAKICRQFTEREKGEVRFSAVAFCKSA